MTMIMFIAPVMDMPKMNSAEMLSDLMGFPIFIGWMMHFMIGSIIGHIVFGIVVSLLVSKAEVLQPA